MPCHRGVPVLQVPVNVLASGSTYPELKEAEEKLILIILISKLFYLLFLFKEVFLMAEGVPVSGIAVLH